MGAASNDESIRAELLETKRALMVTRTELLKAQIIAATRNDVIRLLGCGFISGQQEIPDLSVTLPSEPEVRSAYAKELRGLAAHLRIRASRYEAIAATLDADSGF